MIETRTINPIAMNVRKGSDPFVEGVRPLGFIGERVKGAFPKRDFGEAAFSSEKFRAVEAVIKPLRDIFGSRIDFVERRNIIDVIMVEFRRKFMKRFFDFHEVYADVFVIQF